MLRRVAVTVVVFAALAACTPEVNTGSPVPAPQTYCDEPGTAVNVDPAQEPCKKLSGYRLFKQGAFPQQPNEGVVSYEMATPLFSDYARKFRFIYLPPGTEITYSENGVFAFPVGTVIAKTFAFPLDMRAPDKDVRIVETRILMHRPEGWVGLPYVWNEDESDAELAPVGKDIAMGFTATDGTHKHFTYHVPDQNQCKKCHQTLDGMAPIGPKARNLNHHGQLEDLVTRGWLTGAPADLATAPTVPLWDDAASGTLEQRARAYLDNNCAHCHQPRGPARTSGLYLSYLDDEPGEYGVCKPPVAAAQGTGGFQYSIVPGNPDESILVFRLNSVKPGIMMPELGKALVHEEGVKTVRDWIASMPATDCTAP